MTWPMPFSRVIPPNIRNSKVQPTKKHLFRNTWQLKFPKLLNMIVAFGPTNYRTVVNGRASDQTIEIEINFVFNILSSRIFGLANLETKHCYTWNESRSENLRPSKRCWAKCSGKCGLKVDICCSVSIVRQYYIEAKQKQIDVSYHNGGSLFVMLRVIMVLEGSITQWSSKTYHLGRFWFWQILVNFPTLRKNKYSSYQEFPLDNITGDQRKSECPMKSYINYLTGPCHSEPPRKLRMTARNFNSPSEM